MKLSCLIVDDEPLARSLLTAYVHKIPYLQLVGACADPLEAVEVLHREPIDVLFLDVQMPNLTGIHLLKALPEKPYVVLTTAYSEYALEGYELDVMDYLLKPITFERFFRAAEKAAQRCKQSVMPVTETAVPAQTPDHIFVKDGTALIKVKLSDILFIEGLRDYVAIHTPEKKIVTLQRMKHLESLLPAEKFTRVHHSFIIALDWIDAVHKEKVQIGKAMIPISASYQKAFKALMNERLT